MINQGYFVASIGRCAGLLREQRDRLHPLVPAGNRKAGGRRKPAR